MTQTTNKIDEAVYGDAMNDHAPKTTPIKLKLRPWPVRFFRQYKSLRRYFGIWDSLIGAWKIFNA